MNAMEHWRAAEDLLSRAEAMLISTDRTYTQSRIELAAAHFKMARYMFDQDRFHPVNRMKEVQDS